jgi:predicted RNA-binding Zn ribbon-like protein
MMPLMFRAGAGRLCLDFVRTLRGRGTSSMTEELPDAAALTAWLRQCGPVEMPGRAAGARAGQAVQARELREAIHRLLVDGARGCGRAARETINRAAAHPVSVPRIDARGRVRWVAEDPVAATFALLARDALDLVVSGDVARVRECADPGCGALFFDSSRPGRRRWCSMNVCGNKAKKSALREKAAQISL